MTYEIKQKIYNIKNIILKKTYVVISIICKHSNVNIYVNNLFSYLFLET